MAEATKDWYALRNAVYAGELADAEQLLKANPTLLTTTNGIGETVLHFLAVENDIKGVAWLRTRDFDVNTKNQFGTPVVFEVAQLEYKELFLWLAANGSDLRTRDAKNADIFEYLSEYGKTEMAEWVKQHVT